MPLAASSWCTSSAVLSAPTTEMKSHLAPSAPMRVATTAAPPISLCAPALVPPPPGLRRSCRWPLAYWSTIVSPNTIKRVPSQALMDSRSWSRVIPWRLQAFWNTARRCWRNSLNASKSGSGVVNFTGMHGSPMLSLSSKGGLNFDVFLELIAKHQHCWLECCNGLISSSVCNSRTASAIPRRHRLQFAGCRDSYLCNYRRSGPQPDVAPSSGMTEVTNVAWMNSAEVPIGQDASAKVLNPPASGFGSTFSKRIMTRSAVAPSRLH